MSDRSEARARLVEIGDRIVAGVERCVPSWAERQVRRILDAWAALDTDERALADGRARVAGTEAADRVAAELRALFATDPTEQRATPLEIVRGAVREPTRVLRDAGVPPVVRGDFDERAWPDDDYGLVPRTLGDLGDDELAPLHLAWGLAKTAVLRGG